MHYSEFAATMIAWMCNAHLTLLLAQNVLAQNLLSLSKPPRLVFGQPFRLSLEMI
jgi:hypothetical protein